MKNAVLQYTREHSLKFYLQTNLDSQIELYIRLNELQIIYYVVPTFGY